MVKITSRVLSKEKVLRHFFKDKELDELRRGIVTEIKPFLDSIRKMDKESASVKQFNKALDVFNQRIYGGMEIYGYIMKDLSTDRSSRYDTKEEIRVLLAYLGLVESLGNTVTDVVVMSLVSNGRDFHIESPYVTPRIRRVVAIEDLETHRVSLTTKLNFLRDNGISVFPSVVDSELGNIIAHLKFEIRKNEVYIRGKPSLVTVMVAWFKLFEAITTVEGLLEAMQKRAALSLY